MTDPGETTPLSTLAFRAMLLNFGLALVAYAASPAVTHPDRLIESISMGLVISLIFSEVLGLATGGLIVPGYVALVMDQPARVAMTIAIALATYLIIRFLSRYMLLYGRRRTVLVMLIAFALGGLTRSLLHDVPHGDAMIAIGFIIPGLIADWMERQGLVATVSTVVLSSAFVRLLLILTGPREIP